MQIFHNEKIGGENENDFEDNGKLLLSNVQSAMIKDERPNDEEHVKPSSNFIISESRTSIDENPKDHLYSTGLCFDYSIIFYIIFNSCSFQIIKMSH